MSSEREAEAGKKIKSLEPRVEMREIPGWLSVSVPGEIWHD